MLLGSGCPTWRFFEVDGNQGLMMYNEQEKAASAENCLAIPWEYEPVPVMAAPVSSLFTFVRCFAITRNEGMRTWLLVPDPVW